MLTESSFEINLAHRRLFIEIKTFTLKSLSHPPKEFKYSSLLSQVITFTVIFTVDEAGNLNAAHILSKYNREGKDTFSERPTTVVDNLPNKHPTLKGQR